MRNLFLAALLSLLSLPAQAQYVQGGAVNAAPDTIGGNWQAQSSYSYTFKAPLTSPCTIMVSSRFPGQIISDTQNNTYSVATKNADKFDQLSNSNTCQSGANTVTIKCLSICWSQFTVSEYAGVWLPDQVSDEIQNVIGKDAWTAPITPTQNGELIIGIGNNHTTNAPGIVGTNGFTVRANANQFIADLVQTTAAPIYSEVTYSSAVNWCQRTISFKPLTPVTPPPQPDSITVQGQLLWCAKCDGTDNVPATGNLVVAQTGAGSTTQNIMPDGSVSVKSTVDVSQDPLEFVIELTDGAGNVQPGATLTLTFPKFELNSPGFLVGTITIGIVRIAHVTDAEGNPAIRIVDVSAFSIGK